MDVSIHRQGQKGASKLNSPPLLQCSEVEQILPQVLGTAIRAGLRELNSDSDFDLAVRVGRAKAHLLSCEQCSWKYAQLMSVDAQAGRLPESWFPKRVPD